MAKDYRILSLDGGGAWALIEALALSDLFPDRTGREILGEFDLVAANSGGSLVLGGLIENLAPFDIANVFLDDCRRREIFTGNGFAGRLADWIGMGPRYRSAAKLDAIRAVLARCGDARLSGLDMPTKLVICGYDCDRERAVFFRSYGSQAASKARRRSDPTVAEAIHVSTNAPVNYFDRPAQVGDGRFWDGAIGGYNNPVLAGLTEALAAGVPRESVKILSLGTGRVFLPMASEAGEVDPLLVAPAAADQPWPLGLLADVRKLAASIVAEPPDAAVFTAHVVLGGRLPRTGRDKVIDGPLVRLNPFLAPWFDGRTWTLTDPASGFTLDRQLFADLRDLDMDAIHAGEIRSIKALADLWLAGRVRNQPIRFASDTLRCEVGQDSYAAAKAAWQRLCQAPVAPAKVARPAA